MDLYLVSRINNKRYALGLDQVQEVITAVPGDLKKQGYLRVPFDGRLLPVLDLCQILNEPHQSLQLSTRIVVFSSNTPNLDPWGLQAPGLTEVKALNPKSIHTAALPLVSGVSHDPQGPVSHLSTPRLLLLLQSLINPTP